MQIRECLIWFVVMVRVGAGDLSPGRKIAQAIHAAHEFADTFPDKYRSWRDVSNRIVVCEVP